jgi:hypothetical protein
MTNELMISLLKQANTGTEMLNVLDALNIDNLAADRPVPAVLTNVDQVVQHVQQMDGNHRVNAVATLQEIAF